MEQSKSFAPNMTVNLEAFMDEDGQIFGGVLKISAGRDESQQTLFAYYMEHILVHHDHPRTTYRFTTIGLLVWAEFDDYETAFAEYQNIERNMMIAKLASR